MMRLPETAGFSCRFSFSRKFAKISDAFIVFGFSLPRRQIPGQRVHGMPNDQVRLDGQETSLPDMRSSDLLAVLRAHPARRLVEDRPRLHRVRRRRRRRLRTRRAVSGPVGPEPGLGVDLFVVDTVDQFDVGHVVTAERRRTGICGCG
ncbi:MAG: hypothetical protein BJ554DRAFT_1565 [Olpidium bornovanus]|uniref:Uncharacterized protein n=1 Tax=Olpidium bornovanus TaxID=278681 RepID=A0A8H7ZRW0_9FUNG|nr:MAG: hypothetical protein BJ554DRAFT_1565 [Olpidium bornovanus]